MKNKLLPLIITFISIYSYAQDQFEKGYFIDNDNQKTDCYIKNKDWKYNPTDFKYKLLESSDKEEATISAVKEFKILNSVKFVRATVDIDKSSEFNNRLSKVRNPEFKEETLYLKVLVDDEASLYQYEESSLIRFFYKVKDNEIKQLIYKHYKSPLNKNVTSKNTDFKKQIYNDLKSENITLVKTLELEYDKKSLVEIFEEYNQNTNQEYQVYNFRKKRDLFNLNLKLGIDYPNAIITNNNNPQYKNVNSGKQFQIRYGIEAEFIIPVMNNKWAIIIEPTYQSFKSKSTQTTNAPFVVERTFELDIDYKSIELPIGVRYYYFLNKKSKLFINASFIYDFYFKNSSINIKKTNSNSKLDIATTPYNLSLGIGYKYHKKVSVELRCYSTRDLTKQYLSWESNYNNLSLIVGYSLF
ncbi:hypothetical protein AXE80_09155 [Wenyingzhuangia fucanilytica]|uniref:Outer membrane protein beta-barrel domain-containing protein n=1 Tax=Wenyingzhuangia fucanilytica TaxID=1790137 RepID=A0A1B1Y6P4_9FLAO|nr:outer membrane beta-barrel protein [Wenyingzhuangia fucanilytica]ANW96435.1 hypothetical protein AXE80_09155 [Wenyingzhuangia fucanilytica]